MSDRSEDDSMTRTDEELVAAATAGDLESFNELVSRWERPIFALAFRTLGREEEARDVVQEAFLRAYRGLRAFKGEAKFSSWLYRITLNLCRDWMRRQRRTPVVAVPEGVDPLEVADREAAPTESVEDLVARREMSRAVSAAMAELPDEQRTAILLKEYHGLTFQEIADMLGCPLSTVKTRLYQGLSVLRRRLERRQAEEAALRRATWESTL
jgi:RNA polymerase sigma-70 factor (ECF subfamily)